MSEPRLIEVRKNVLKQNDVLARELREQFPQFGSFYRQSCFKSRFGQNRFFRTNFEIAEK